MQPDPDLQRAARWGDYAVLAICCIALIAIYTGALQ
jgi:hypothetical protein